MKPTIIIAAVDDENGIGISSTNSIPWSLSDDLKYFSTTTKAVQDSSKKNALIMGRKTFESIKGTLTGRLIFVLSKNKLNVADGVFNSLESAFNVLDLLDVVESIYVIGGSAIYKKCMTLDRVTVIKMTHVFANFKCDIFFPKINHTLWIEDSVSKLMTQNNLQFQHIIYKRDCLNVDRQTIWGEQGYLNLIRNILQYGTKSLDRTEIGTLRVPGSMLKFDLSNGNVPLFTTKRVGHITVLRELMFFRDGNTSTKALTDNNVQIWSGNTSREALDKYGFKNRAVGDVGPTYPFMFRSAGAKWIEGKQSYRGEGVDQLQGVIDELRRNPHSRRAMINLWDPSYVPLMTLPPCLFASSFYIINNELHCHATMRSCDVILGLPFNCMSYATLTILLSSIIGVTPGTLTISMADTHIYLNHIDAAYEQIGRYPFPSPNMTLLRTVDNIDDFTLNDIKIENYQHHGKLDSPTEMAI